MMKPSKIICIGLNYRDHAEELKMPIPEVPVLFMKPTTALIGDQDKIVYPKMASELHYEAELAIIIKDKIKNICEAEASKHIKGYACANDVTARDLQKLDGQWIRAKSFDTFCPVGPKVVALEDAGNLNIKLYLNGELKQASNTKQMIFPPAYLVAFISEVMTLLPNDIILSGTPPGVGPMRRGDKVEVEIQGIGRLTNFVV